MKSEVPHKTFAKGKSWGYFQSHFPLTLLMHMESLLQKMQLINVIWP